MTDHVDVELSQIFAGPMGNCLYALADPVARRAMIVDPAFQPLELYRQVRDAGYEVDAVLATHTHPDHIGGEIFGHKIPGLRELRAEVELPIYIHGIEAERLMRETGTPQQALRIIEDNQQITLGALTIDCLHTPGHSPGGVAFLVGGKLIAGDTLFVQGVGRVDLPGSDVDAMFHSLRRLAALPPETEVYPGHNYGPQPSSTIGRELQLNPYLRVEQLEQWRIMMGVLD